MENFDLLKNIVKETSEKYGISKYELYYSEDTSLSAETYRDEISSFSSSVSGLLLYRCIVDGKLGYASTEFLDEEEMRKLVERAVENAKVIERDEEAIIFGGAKPEEYRTVPKNEFTMPDAAKIREEVMSCRNILYAEDERMTDGAECGAYASRFCTRLFNSNGLDLSRSGGSCSVYMQSLLDDGSEKQYDYDFLYTLDAADAEKKALAEQVVAGANAKFHAKTIKTGKYNVVFDHKQMSVVLQTFLSVFFAEQAQKGLSLLKGKTGETIASDIITITDDPFYPSNPMQLPFDGEGVPTKTKNVVENGVLKTLLYNLTTAKKDNVETTGNASRSASSIGTRVFTFYINPGQMTKDELLRKAGSGIYINELKGLHAGANPVTGDFSIESEGFLIEDGKLGAPIKSFTVAGNFFDLLKSITDIDNVLDLRAPGSTRIASPDVLVPDMSVAGE